MDRGKITVSAFALGAAFTYFSDPNRGKRRRVLVRDKATKTWHRFTALTDKAQRDLFNRAGGAYSEITGAFEDHHTENSVLIQRVRSRVGRVVSHPHAIEVSVENGKTVLKGPILQDEAGHLLSVVKSVPGVEDVANRLEIHEDAGKLSSLQGGVPRTSRSEFTQQNWAPALRMAAGSLGGALILYGARNRGTARAASNLAGAALLARAICNREFRDIAGLGEMARVIEIDKAIHLHAPVEDVFKIWSNYRAFPRFMTHLKEVRDLGNGQSHWVAEGPAGIPISWDAEVTQCVPNKLLAWRSLPGTAVQTEGVVRFDKDEDGGTRIGIRMFYKPPGGVIGHCIASLLGADPKHEIDDDMVRLKSLIELGHTRAHGVAVTREELKPEPVSRAV
jgi:uncharacterized membrane protein